MKKVMNDIVLKLMFNTQKTLSERMKIEKV